MLGYLIRRAIALQCFILVSLGLSQRCDFNPWKTNIFRKEYDHIRRRPKIFEEASKISELDMEAMKVLRRTPSCSPQSPSSFRLARGGGWENFAQKSLRDFNGRSVIAVCDRTLVRGYQAHFLRGCEEEKSFWLSDVFIFKRRCI